MNIQSEDGPDIAIKDALFEKYFKPYISGPISAQNMIYLREHAWHGFLLQIGTNEIKTMLFVQWMCTNLLKTDSGSTNSLLGALFQEDYDSIGRISQAEEALRDSRDEPAKWLSSAMNLYKTYFESEFRLWSTIPYCYISQIYGIKTHFKTTADVIHVGSSEKFQALKNLAVDIPQGDVKSLILGFDNDVRNAGAGHDSWEISDKDTIVLSVRDPKSGKEKGIRRLEFTTGTLGELLDQVRKTIWSLKMGAVLFSANHPLKESIPRTKELKIREIEVYLKSFAKDRWLALEKFQCSDDRKSVFLSLRYSPQTLGVGGSVFMGSGEKYDLITVEAEEPYSTQVIGIIQYLLIEFFVRGKLPDITVECHASNGNLIGHAEFDAAELEKLFKKPREMPIPRTGALPEGKYSMQATLRVQYGTKAQALEQLKKRARPNLKIVG